jgi:hypothetical protein
MASLLTALFVLPGVIHGVNEFTKTVDDIVNFDYNKYINDKISNMSIKSQIIFLKQELEHNKSQYDKYNDEYKNLFKNDKKFDKELTEEIKKKKEHYYNICNELRKKFKNL